MKKKFNWLGWIIVILYVIMFFFFCVLGTYFNNNGFIQYRNISYSIALAAFITGVPMLPIWYDWALGKLLPVQKSVATVINKQITTGRIHFGNGTKRGVDHHFITFHLSDGEILELFVKKKKYYIIFVGEQGLLSYKREGKHKYFIDFERH